MPSATEPRHLVGMLLVTRKEFLRGLEGLRPAEAQMRIGGLNCIGWIVGHVAWQESFLWQECGQGQSVPERLRLFATGRRGLVPDYGEVLADWHKIARATEPFLRSLDQEELKRHFTHQSPKVRDLLAEENAGTLLTRCIMHYWSHIGEVACIRSLLGHQAPQFVGGLESCRYGE